MERMLDFNGRKKSSGLILSHIPSALPEAEVLRTLHRFGAVDFSTRLPALLDLPERYSLKVTFLDPDRARRARIGVKQLTDGRWKGVQVRKSKNAAGPVTVRSLPPAKCAALLNEAAGPLGWSTKILALRAQPPAAAAIRRSKQAAGVAAGATDLGLFAVERSALSLPHGLLDTGHALRSRASDAFGETTESFDFGADVLAAANLSTGLPTYSSASTWPGGQHIWSFVSPAVPSFGLPVSLPVLVSSGERPLPQKPPRVVPQNFGAHTLGTDAARKSSTAAISMPPVSAVSKTTVHSCLSAKVAVLVRNPDGSITESIGHAGCDCAPATGGSRFEAVQEVIERLDRAEKLQAVVANAASVSRGLPKAGVVTASVVERRPSHGVAGTVEDECKGGEWFALLRRESAAASAAGGGECSGRGDGLEWSAWHPSSTSAARSAAARTWKETVFACEDGERGFHIKSLIGDAQRAAYASLQLIAPGTGVPPLATS
jgi:hypothetical protein